MEIFEVNLKNGDVIKINGVCFVKVGNNLVKATVKDGVPEIKEGVTSVETRHPDGRIDCTIKVPCLSLSAEAKEIK